jgi:CheY-like chemotaxis protein
VSSASRTVLERKPLGDDAHRSVEHILKGGRQSPGRFDLYRMGAGDPDRPRLRVGVRDTGPGIPAESLSRIFDPFERLGAERSGEEGSTFWVTLDVEVNPLERLANGERPSRPDIEHGTLPSAAILYIEDNLANLTLVETILDGEPEITLILALQGQPGLGLACEHRPALILLDLHLPDIPGLEVHRRLTSTPATSRIPGVELMHRAAASSHPAFPATASAF